MGENLQAFKAFIRVVKSIAFDGKQSNFSYGSFDTVEIIREPLVYTKDKKEVKEILLKKYPQFFPNGKVYERETKDQAQFFYVVIFPLYQYELDLVNAGEWICDYCGHVHENEYTSKPLRSSRYQGLRFCSKDYLTGNDIYELPDCFGRWKREVGYSDNVTLADNSNYVDRNSLNYIYKITEKATGKSYIGKTRNAPFFRWWDHLTHSVTPFLI